VLRILGLGSRVSGLGFRDSGFGLRVSGLGFRVSGFGSRVSGLGFRVSGLPHKSQTAECASRIAGWARQSIPYCMGTGVCYLMIDTRQEGAHPESYNTKYTACIHKTGNVWNERTAANLARQSIPYCMGPGV
jgi:hypothetical protein